MVREPVTNAGVCRFEWSGLVRQIIRDTRFAAECDR